MSALGRGEATAVTRTTADGLGVAELGNLAGLDREGAAADFGLKNVVVRILLVRNHEITSCVFFARVGGLALETGV